MKSFVLDFCAGLIEIVRIHALVPLGVTLSVSISKPFSESTDFGEDGILPCCVWLLYIRALFCGDLKAWIGTCLGDGFGSEAVSSFERRTIYRRIEGCVILQHHTILCYCTIVILS